MQPTAEINRRTGECKADTPGCVKAAVTRIDTTAHEQAKKRRAA
jgi:hypothetical protein